MPDIGLRIGLAQLNQEVGALKENTQHIAAACRQLEGSCDLVVTPELSVSGYPPEDLVLQPHYVAACMTAVTELAANTKDCKPALLVGCPWLEEDRVYNAALLLHQGKIIGKTFKHDLPTYGVFDEKRLFAAGPLPAPLFFRGRKLGVMICEDFWTAAAARQLKNQGAEILLVPNASPYEQGKHNRRLAMARDRVADTGLPLVYVNQIGGQDELVFDGASFVMSAAGELTTQYSQFEEQVGGVAKSLLADGIEEVYRAIVLGLRDYVLKNGFSSVILGLSGGIDSALVAAMACDALGPEQVKLVMLPSRFTAAMSNEDAAAIANHLGCKLETLPIDALMDVYAATVAPLFVGEKADITEENIQSRIRGSLLMAMSNKFGHLLLTTGNKSEYATGYATLYGDMCGSYAPLKDLYKGMVYACARWRNSKAAVIPERVLTRSPSAELRANQTDQDSLPDYDLLDNILSGLIEHRRSVAELVAAGLPEHDVLRVEQLLRRSEFKRRQAPPGPKVSARAFGKEWQMPLTRSY